MTASEIGPPGLFQRLLDLSARIVPVITLTGVLLVVGLLFVQPDRQLSGQVGAVAEQLGKIREQMASRPGAVANEGAIRAELAEFSERLTAVEAAADERGPGRGRIIAVIAILSAGLVAATLLARHRMFLWAAITATLSIGSATLVAINPESLLSVSLNVDGEKARSGPAVVALFARSDGKAIEVPAYAIPFDQQQKQPNEIGRDILARLSRALRPCIGDSRHGPLVLRVSGFASAARYSGTQADDNQRNSDLAAGRGRNVHAMLLRGICPSRACGTKRLRIDLAELTFSEMAGRRPIADASTLRHPRVDTEFLNRTVLVTIEESGACPNS
jgi:hypothetical protein